MYNNAMDRPFKCVHQKSFLVIPVTSQRYLTIEMYG